MRSTDDDQETSTSSHDDSVYKNNQTPRFNTISFYALCNDKVVTPETYTEGTITCLVCKEILRKRTSHKRKRNGVRYTVRDHFVHANETSHNPESVEHLAAKRMLCTHNNISYVMPCIRCGTEMTLQIEGSPCEEQAFDIYRLDVAFLREEQVIGAVEVLHTHEIGPVKEAFLTSSGIAWCEARSHEILDALLQQRPIRVENCAVKYCSSCAYEEERAKRNMRTYEARVERRKRMIAASWLHKYENRCETCPLLDDIFPRVKELYSKMVVERALRVPEGVINGTDHLEELCARKQFDTVREYACWTGRRDSHGRPEETERNVSTDTKLYARSLLRGTCIGCLRMPTKGNHMWCRRCFLPNRSRGHVSPF